MVQKWNCCWSKSGEGLQGVTGEDFGPTVVWGLWWMGQNPKVFLRMVDEGDGSFCGGGDGPGLTEEVDGVVGVDAALELQSQMQV